MGTGGAQHIPRPAQWRPGGAPTWVGHDLTALDDVDVVAAAIARRPFSEDIVPPGTARAAVLVPLVVVDGRAGVVLTRRAGHLRQHSGEVSFPGGRMEHGEGVWQTALREANEEISLDPSAVEHIGRLEPVPTRVSNHLIHPVVGRVTGTPSLHPDPGEVARIFTVALADLVRGDTYSCEQWVTPLGEVPIHFFHIEGETVWGATARMLHSLIESVVGGAQGPA